MGKSLDHTHEQVPPDYYDYGIKYNIFQHFWHTRRFNQVSALLAGITATKILDVGCHGGRFTQELYNAFPSSSVYGIDISSIAIDYAKRKYPKIDFRVARAENLPFRANQFDLVTCFEVLEHVEDPAKVIKEIKRVVKKEGDVIILVPTENILFKIIWFLWTRFGAGSVWHHTHVQKFQHHTLDHLLESQGLTVVKRKLFSLGMLLLIHAKRVR